MENHLEQFRQEFILPNDRFKESYIEALKEFKEVDGDTVDIEERERNFDAFLEKLKVDESTNDEDRVPNIQYWLVEGNKYIGRGNYRPILNDNLKFRGGNIGYTIRPSERGKGYASLIVQKLLEKARSDNLKDVILTCDSDNIASTKVIEKAGGILEGGDIDGNGIGFNRYRIKL